MMFAPSAHGCRRCHRSKRQRRKKGQDHVHETILVEILSRLPVKSLLRFKCVCKSWYALIASPHFIFMHLKNYAPTCLLVHKIGQPNISMLSLTMHNTNGCAMVVDLPLPASIKAYPLERFNPVNVHGSCNGIVCISDRGNEIALWNPATKKSKLLPRSQFYRYLPQLLGDRFYGVSGVGFGFDAKTNDYKVLQVVMFNTNGFEQFELYSLRSDSWKMLNSNIGVPPSFEMDFMERPEAISISCGDNINICWLVLAEHDQVWDHWKMVLFDVSEEKFIVIRLPPKIAESLEKSHNWGLFSFKESLALVCLHHSDDRDAIVSSDIWLSPNFCAQPNSWIKLFSIDDQHGPVAYRPMGILEDGRILFQSFYDGGEFLFDPRTGTSMNLQLERRLVAFSNTFTFKESLIAIS